MSEAPEAHRLGPHVVGTRVVVRRVLPGETGPSGGPAMTDVLGVCLRWSEGECVVQPDDGPAVTIPWRLIVSGKPVPPRASARQRVSPREVELRAGVLWPEMTTEPLGEWLLRECPPQGGRRLRRANSVLAMGDPGVPLPEAAQRVRQFYLDRDRRPLAMVEAGSPLAADLAGLGWSEVDRVSAHAQLASVARVTRTCGVPPPEDPVGDDTRVVLELDGARGRAALDGDWLGLHSVDVDPDRRRTRLASRVVAGLVAWGAERGATTVWLHVEVANAPAIALYEGLGFRTHHTYRYLTPA